MLAGHEIAVQPWTEVIHHMRYLNSLLLIFAMGLLSASCKDNTAPDLGCTVEVQNTKPGAVYVLYDGNPRYGGCQLLSKDSFVLPDEPLDGTKHTLTFSYTDPTISPTTVTFIVYRSSNHIGQSGNVNCIVTSSGTVYN